MRRGPLPRTIADEPATRPAVTGATGPAREEFDMMLATTKVKDLDHFLEVFGTKGADKRGSHGSQGATVYRDPIEEDRVWAVFDWDEAGWTAFATDPETPGIMQEAGHLGRPSLGQYLGSFNA
jgi:hypothetical protein